jgi:hypothetical protein
MRALFLYKHNFKKLTRPGNKPPRSSSSNGLFPGQMNGKRMAIDEQLQSLVYFLTDHLFAAMDAGEKIRVASYTQTPSEQELSSAEIMQELEDQRLFLNELANWEEDLVTKINQARQWSRYLKDHDSSFKPLIELFNSATNPLTDVAAQIADHHDRHFEGGDHPDWFIKSRAMTEKKLPDGRLLSLTTRDTYLIGGHLRLGQLLDLLETFLETLEARFPNLWLPAEEAMLDNDPFGEQPI